MAYDSIELIVIAALAIVGVVGGIPQLLVWIKLRPHLRITQGAISKLPNENYKYQLHLGIENQSKLLQRNGDASNVVADFFVVDKNGVQSGATTNLMISTYLCSGTKIPKDLEAYLSLIPDGNPYSIIFRATSAEGNAAKKKIAFDAAPVLYS